MIYVLSTAPEVLSREPYGHAADWWSLGVLTCRMLTDEVRDELFIILKLLKSDQLV